MKVQITSLLCSLLTASVLLAQSYTHSVYEEAYTPLFYANSLNNGALWDDPDYAIPESFSMEFFGQLQSGVSIAELGAQIWIGDQGQYIGGTFTPFLADVIDRGDSISESEIKYTIVGTPGQRVLTIEWENVGFYEEVSNGTSEMFVNFQCELNEQDGRIRSMIGPHAISNPSLIFEYGLGPSIGMGADIDGTGYGTFYLLTGDPTAPQATTDAYGDLSLTTVPPTNTVYEFNPLSVHLYEEEGRLLNVYPNPASDKIFFNTDNEEMSLATIKLLDTRGRVVLQDRVGNGSFDLSNVEAGHYIILVEREKRIIREQIIVQ